MSHLANLRTLMLQEKLEAYIVPSGDEFMNEFVPPYARRLEWLTGFTGSAGMAVILKEKAALFTDGRYTLQAAQQLPKGEYEIINTADKKPWDWIRENLALDEATGLDPMLHTKEYINKYRSFGRVSLCNNLIDKIWKDKPQKPATQISTQPPQYSGELHTDKINMLLGKLKDEDADCLFLTSPESICWLLNIRGNDVPYTPLVLSRLLVDTTGKGWLFLDRNKDETHNPFPSFTISPLSAVPDVLKSISGKRVMVDKATCPYLFFQLLEGHNDVIEGEDPCILPKACKNQVEVQGATDAHIQDGAAVVSFLHWLEMNYKKQHITEISAAEKLLEFRKKRKNFMQPSFETIAGFAANGAVVHYRSTPATNKRLSGKGIFLLDSGGQYLNGTTDITRTIAIGAPTKEQKRNFTLVLKGHIALATAKFPLGTSGHQLDALARQYLWQAGLDYDHGTGHGVGSYLSVHEGPQRISKAPNEVALHPGMIISNEPGYYKAGEYGIRIENLVVVEANAGSAFLYFRTLTLAPIDTKLVDFKLLNEQEKKWLKDYHSEILKKLSPLLDAGVKKWLREVI